MFGIPLLILFAISIQPLSAFLYGKDTTLRATPLSEQAEDKNAALFVQFDIEQVPIDLVSLSLQTAIHKGEPLEGMRVFGKLEKTETFDRLSEVTEVKPKEKYYLAGRVTKVEKNEKGEFLQVNFGLANIYIPKDAQTSDAPDSNFFAHVKVQNGYGYVKDIAKESH